MLSQIHSLILIGILGLSTGIVSSAQNRVAEWDRLLQDGRALIEQGRYREAQPKLTESLRLIDAERVTGYPAVIATSNLASCLQDLGDYVEAEKLHRRAIHEGESLEGGRRLAMAVALNGYGLLLNRLGRAQQAIDYYERSLALRKELLGVESTAVARQIHNLAKLYSGLGEFEKSDAMFRQAIVIWEKSQEPEAASDLAASLTGLASLTAQRGDLEGAIPLSERAVSLWESHIGRNHPTFAMLLNNLATLYIKAGQLARAEGLLAQALVIARETFGEDHPETGTILANYASVLEDTKRKPEARTFQAQARNIQQRHVHRNFLHLTVDASQLVQKER